MTNGSEQRPPTESAAQSAPPAEPPLIKLLIDLGPLLVFFGFFYVYGIRTATMALMAATLVSVVAAKLLLGKVSASLLVTAALVTVFGALTYAFDDPSFIKMKPTAVNLLFAGVLGYGLSQGKFFLKHMLGEAMALTDTGWGIITKRWIGLFIALAVLNEVIWRTMSETAWVNFKVFGILPLTLIFAALQLPVLRQHAAKSEDSSGQ
ncbi:MAG: septation protein A [Hyphomicrobiaceae bacterium]|nr:septation protein A [Hyphomicrobiaceae bacterium]